MYGIMRERWTLYSIAAFFSILLSVWAAIKTVVINPDAICYLYSAEALEKGLTFASHLCEQAKWPFYSILIYGVTQLTHLSSIHAAYLLNGFFSLMTVISFVAIVDLLTKNRRLVALSVLIILLAHELNGLRVEIIRDHGFWAFYLLSLFFGLRYFLQKNNDSWCNAFLWSVCLIIATLFRIEGAVFLLLFPFVAFFATRQTVMQKFKTFLQFYSIILLGGFALLCWLMLHPAQQLGRLTEIQFQMQHGMTEFIHSFQQTASALSAHVLNGFSARDAYWIVMGMLVIWYMFIVISNVSPIYALLIIYAWIKKSAYFTRETRWVLWAYSVINILITFIFFVDHLFLAKRYLIALSLILMLWIPFALDNLILQNRKWLLLLAVIGIMIYGAGGIFDFGQSKKYIRDGGDWLALHAASNKKIYSNDYQLLYYSQHVGNTIFSVGKKFENLNSISNGKWRQYDYIALRVSHNDLKNNSILREIKLSPIVIYQNDRNDQVRIYEIHPKKIKRQAVEN